MTTDSFLQALFDTAPYGVILFDREGRIRRANASFLRLAKCPLRDLEGCGLISRVHPDERKEFETCFFNLIRGYYRQFTIELRLLRRNGSPIWTRCVFVLACGGEADSFFLYGIVENITRRKRGEMRLRRSMLNAERTTQIKSEFLANMSHEIRTPIHTIVGMADLLCQTDLDEEQSEYTKQIGFAADILLNLVNDILDFSKIEAGKLELETIDFDLYRLIEGVLDLVALEAHRKGLELIFRIEGHVPRNLMGDPARIRQILVNLTGNAVKFTSRGEVAVVLRCLQEDAESAAVRCSVRDTGIGIPDAKRGQLFASFSQIDSTTTRRYGGTGLGLSISKKLTDLMGGDIGVESGSGKGSTFWFDLVLKKDSAAPADEPACDFAGLRVLLVDDNDTAREAAASCLTGWNCAVAEAVNADEALTLLREASAGSPFDACIIDQILPGRDGWQLASEINSDKRINATKLILMSPVGRSGEEAKMKLLHWFDGYLTKPIFRDELRRSLEQAFSSTIDLDDADAAELISLDDDMQSDDARLERPREGASVLIAEDHEVNQQLFRTLLERAGYRVTVTSDGKEAVDAAEKLTFDIVFLDVQMPGLNGYEAARTLRARGYAGPIVGVTASTVPGELGRCIDSGMDEVLNKPFKNADLLPLLRRLLAAPPGAEGAEAAVADCPAGTGMSDSDRSPSGRFSYDEALDNFLGNREVLDRVLDGFIEKTGAHLERMNASAACGDLETIREDAHAVKGGAWNLAARALGDAAGTLEEAARNGDASAAAAALDALRREFRLFREER